MTADPVSGGVRRRDVLRTASMAGAGGTAAALLGRPGVASAAASAGRNASAPGSTLARAARQVPAPSPAVPDAPLLADPIYNGSTDPTIVYNRDAGQWWMFYTQRRSNDTAGGGVAWVHGSAIGIATSDDGGVSWLYRGVAQGLDFEVGHNTYWAPEVVWHDGTYHMYLGYITGIPNAWPGFQRHIVHYTSTDLWNWRFGSVLELSSDYVIDPCIWPLPGNPATWRMWYKDEHNHSHIYAADSLDLRNWHVVGPVLTNRGQEGPNVFSFAGSFWMVTDPDATGLLVYRSDDLQTWTQQASGILATPGTRPQDDAPGHHCFLLSQGQQAYIVYFTEFSEATPAEYVQVAPLAVINGQLTADRDTPFTMAWQPGLTPTLRGGTQPGT